MATTRVGVKAGRKRSVSLEVAQSATCAVLYAMGSYLTAYISSPWGSGQFRPAVVIPAIFATLFGPFVGGIGAAPGCQFNFTPVTLEMLPSCIETPMVRLAASIIGFLSETTIN